MTEDNGANEKIENMIRHLHTDLENMRRDMIMLMHKVDGIAFLHEVSRNDIENMVNVFDVNLDELYSPIDDKDREEWKEHLRKEKKEITKG